MEIKPKRHKRVQKRRSHLFTKKTVLGNKCAQNDLPRDTKNRIKTQKKTRNKHFWESVVFWLRKKSHRKCFLTFFEYILRSFLGTFCSTLECLFYRFLGGGREAFRHQFVLFRNHFFMIFVKNDVLRTWELIFQLELSSHASKTAVFDFNKQGFRLPVFFTFTVFHYL